jgi:hypothetical protein
VIGEPPLLAGGFHENSTDVEVVLVVIAVKADGGSGTVMIIKGNVKLELTAKCRGCEVTLMVQV